MKLFFAALLAATVSAKPQQAVTPQAGQGVDPRSLPKLEHFHFPDSNPDMTEDGKMLFEGDIVLLDEQRDGRQASTNLWTIPVNYVITSSSEPDRSAIEAGINHWRQNTCIEFNEMTEAGVSGHHLRFIKDLGCWSYIGDVSAFLGPNGQDISIGNGCTGLGTVAHEIGHAMGLYHQQSRHDRDTYVRIHFENIQDGRENNFNKLATPNNHSVPYDYTSVMHYGNRFFTKNNLSTIGVLDLRYEGLIGQRGGLSHRDIQIANIMYNCAGGCNSPPTCQNGGFVGQDCQCVCPGNTGGSQCETLNGPYYPNPTCGDLNIVQEGEISSPNYPQNYPANQHCVWLITAPAGCTIEIFVRDMAMYRPSLVNSNTGLYRCVFDYMTFRLNGDIYRDDIGGCDDVFTGQQFTSTGNTAVVTFHSATNFFRGFEITIEFNCPSTTTT